MPCYKLSLVTLLAFVLAPGQGHYARYTSSSVGDTSWEDIKRPIFQRDAQDPTADFLFSASTRHFAKLHKDPKKLPFPLLGPIDKASLCREIKLERIAEEDESETSGASKTRCYKCKDPKSGSSYEYCSSTGRRKSETTVLRQRRSNKKSDEVIAAFEAQSKTGARDEFGNLREPYIFGEEFFTDATEEVAAKQGGPKCEKIVKESMVCMKCHDPKTNGKYEQCSYATQPNEKAYTYTKSSSFGKPKESESPEEGKEKYRTAGSGETSASDGKARAAKPRVEKYESYQGTGSSLKDSKGSSEKSDEQEESSEDCEKIEKDSRSCMVCKDPKTGGNYEKCTYSYQPDDKLYQFSSSKSFPFPKSSKEAPNYGNPKETSRSESYKYPGYTADYSIPKEFKFYPSQKQQARSGYSSSSDDDNEDDRGYRSYYPSASNSKRPSYERYSIPPSDYSRSESERISDSTDEKNCEKIEKDSMTCTVCKDPKTGGNSERCSYSYKPNDKVFSYSKASSFANPGKSEEEGAPTVSTGSSASANRDEPYSYRGKYSFPSESRSYGFTDHAKREPYVFSSSMEKPVSSIGTGAKESRGVGVKDSNDDFFDTSRKKAEIEKFLKEFQKEDRANCKKVMRDKMTCYQCLDDKGFQKEECMFVAEQKPAENRAVYKDLKDFRYGTTTEDPSSEETKDNVSKRTAESMPLEPTASASENVPQYSASVETTEEESKEAEPYAYALETRPRYDKVLGLTLPSYMLEKSEHEAEFDEIVSSTRI